ncbi:hypothetical protein P175DRAFT_0462900 [Aspergillus ochraceoroseus IBT 24754]|uniref:Uncharacterized protein n=1 Tax=Aspergillus ochraceoroseus IBT 24754 TaxID=1392256 RepID=A0A2T5LTV1_9EURO|nr:uncharacterized protein P175DRAFT_0462900 [Aspergillus ochraceoroseus IBT 24754]PTU19709.1 hypothetical protein P175DRAFT_0462900 [Aspergillus ochraceoroseus IBT 24754]
MHLNSYIAVGLAALRLTIAAQVGYFDSETCADPSGFASCYHDADSLAADCTNCSRLSVDDSGHAIDDDCGDGCECVRQSRYVDCAVSSCWNKVYSCEYQLQVGDLILHCGDPPLETIPFWPPPDNADGGCSCNYGRVTYAWALAEKVFVRCTHNPPGQSLDDQQAYEYGCVCCGYSAGLSRLPDICPGQDRHEVGIDKLEQVFNDVRPQWTQCGPHLSSWDCVADFGYPDSIKTYYKPENLPSGTETLHNTGTLTTPVSATVSWAFGSVTQVVTVTSKDAAVSTNTTDVLSANASQGGTTTGTGSGQATATNETKDDSAVHQEARHPFLIAILGMVIGIFRVF